MRKVLLLGVVALALASCETTNQNLYDWGSARSNSNSNDGTLYEQSFYRYYDLQAPENLCNLLCAYDEIINNPGGARNVPPPGICAEYGYLLLSPGTAETFSSNATEWQKERFNTADFTTQFRELGLLMFQKEMEFYPESATFIKPILERLKK